MTQSSYLGSSPYYNTAQINKYLPYLDFWNGTTISANANDTLFTVTAQYHNRPDLLSFDLYGSTGYWWVFALRNPDVIKDPIYDLVAGVNIFLPVKASLPNSGL